MILIIGGIASGKTTYARSLGFAEDTMIEARHIDELTASRNAAGHTVLLHAERLCKDPRSKEEIEGLAAELSSYEVVTCTEVGCGIVPLDPAERRYREDAGRLASALAKQASTVVRMVCGVPVTLKDEHLS